MPRRPREFAAHVPAHVTHRGNNGQTLFARDEDFGAYKYFLKEAADKHRVSVNAYVLMTNHVHLILTAEGSCAFSDVMHLACRRYTAYFNLRNDRTGMLWQERFFAANITTERYLFACYRYIDLNPVRAGIVASADSYRWSSHRFHAWGKDDAVVTPHPAFLELGLSVPTRQASYRALFASPQDPLEVAEIRQASASGRAIGSTPPARGRPRKEMVRGTIF